MERKTKRLRLREVHASNSEALFTINSDAQNRRFEGALLTRAESNQKLDQILADQKASPRTHYRFAITLPPSPALRGWIALTLLRPNLREYEIGWTVDTPLWGRGYATEAAQAVLTLAFTRLNAHRVSAFCHAENQPSLRVMEKLGLQPEALLRETRLLAGAWSDERVYAILEREFKALTALESKPLQV